MTAADVVSGVLLTTGSAFMLLAALGVLRMPDTFRRLHCSTKSATLGVILVLAGAAVGLGTPGAWIRAGLAALFFLLTAPVGGHALGRALWRRRGAGLDPDRAPEHGSEPRGELLPSDP